VFINRSGASESSTIEYSFCAAVSDRLNFLDIKYASKAVSILEFIDLSTLLRRAANISTVLSSLLSLLNSGRLAIFCIQFSVFENWLEPSIWFIISGQILIRLLRTLSNTGLPAIFTELFVVYLDTSSFISALAPALHLGYPVS